MCYEEVEHMKCIRHTAGRTDGRWTLLNEKSVLNIFVVNSVLTTSLFVLLRSVFNVTQPICDVNYLNQRFMT